jgi:nitrite reductase/ring-hydroxylating ferredoxin subunit
MAYERVACVADIPSGRGLCVRVGTLEIGLFRVENEIYAMENRCPHRDSPLSEGRLTGNVIVCQAHGWDFDVRTGFKPGDPDGWPIPCFAVRVEDDQVWIDAARVINLRRQNAQTPNA